MPGGAGERLMGRIRVHRVLDHPGLYTHIDTDIVRVFLSETQMLRSEYLLSRASGWRPSVPIPVEITGVLRDWSLSHNRSSLPPGMESIGIHIAAYETSFRQLREHLLYSFLSGCPPLKDPVAQHLVYVRPPTHPHRFSNEY